MRRLTSAVGIPGQSLSGEEVAPSPKATPHICTYGTY